jgi:transaldolase / glucose-6-phosphate isomerase
MERSKCTIVAGKLQERYHQEIGVYLQGRVLERLWAKDATLWDGREHDHSQIRSNMGWLDLTEIQAPYLQKIEARERVARAEGLSTRVLIAFEGAHLGARATLALQPPQNPSKYLVLDTASPVAIRQLESEIELRKTLFIFKHKSGYRLEEHAMFLYFHKNLELAEVPQPSQHFAAETDGNSYLASLSRVYAFRFAAGIPQGIPSEYSSVLQFGATLSAISGMEATRIMEAGRQMWMACSPSGPPAENPALQLAAFLSAAVVAGRRFLMILTSKVLAPYATLLSRLVGASLSQEDAGMIPIVDRVLHRGTRYEDAAAYVVLTYNGEEDEQLLESVARLRANHAPFVHVHVSQATELLGETFRWEVATVLASASLGVNPFLEPDHRTARTLGAGLLNTLSAGKDTLQRNCRLHESGIQVFIEGATRQEISGLSLTEALASFLRLQEAEGFLTLIAFLERTLSAQAIAASMRSALTETLGVPVLLAYGPRFTDSYAHLLRRGLPPGLYIMITADPWIDIPVPGAP